jgi:hypothetical protein
MLIKLRKLLVKLLPLLQKMRPLIVQPVQLFNKLVPMRIFGGHI